MRLLTSIRRFFAARRMARLGLVPEYDASGRPTAWVNPAVLAELRAATSRL